jgi:SAM-dependent methyltransferase
MARCVEDFMEPGKAYAVVDIGSRTVAGSKATHRALLEGYRTTYTGLDPVAGPNVDVVMTKPYRIPLKSESADIIFCGQVFEHVPFFWVTFLEMARVLKPGGLIFLTAPSRGHRHSPPTDCWRYYPDGMIALASFSGLAIRRAETDFPPTLPDNSRLDYGRIDPEQYWGDTVGVFQKTKSYPKLRIALVREAMIAWANRRPSIQGLRKKLERKTL